MPTEATMTQKLFSEFPDDSGDSTVTAIVCQYHGDDWPMGNSPTVDLRWQGGPADATGRLIGDEEIATLTLAEARAMLKCLRAAVRFAQDVEDGDGETD